MCLAVPGKVLTIEETDPMMRSGRVDFGGIIKTVNLAYTPEVAVGDYVLVHVGFSLSKVDEEEALRVFKYLEEIDELGELEHEKENVIATPARRGGDEDI